MVLVSVDTYIICFYSNQRGADHEQDTVKQHIWKSESPVRLVLCDSPLYFTSAIYS